MKTYTILGGEVLDLSQLDAEERAFFGRCYAAYRAGMNWVEFGKLIEGIQNPLIRRAGGLITAEVLDHPLFEAVSDLEDRLGLRQGELEPEPGDDVAHDPLAGGWVPTAERA